MFLFSLFTADFGNLVKTKFTYKSLCTNECNCSDCLCPESRAVLVSQDLVVLTGNHTDVVDKVLLWNIKYNMSFKY